MDPTDPTDGHDRAGTAHLLPVGARLGCGHERFHQGAQAVQREVGGLELPP